MCQACFWFTALFTLLNILGHATSWRLFTYFLCQMCYVGGIVLFGAHMLFESARNEASAAATNVFFWACAAFTWAAMAILFSTSFIWFWMLHTLCLVLTTWRIRNTLPT